MEDSVLWIWTLALQAGALVKLFFVLASRLRSRKSLQLAVWCRQIKARIRKRWEQTPPADSRCEKELGKMQREGMYLFMRAAFFFSVCVRLVPRQITYLLGSERMNHEFDLTVLVMATFGFVLGFFPCLITPRSQDLWYVVVMLGMDVAYLTSEQVDVRDMVGLTSAGVFVFSVLAKRTWCVVLCIVASLLTAIQLSRNQEDAHGADSIQGLASIYALLFLCVMGVRILIRENVLLKVDLQKRTVETGVVSSLLTACYDAVVEVDYELKLTHDSNQLSSMLLHAPRSGLSGKSLLDFFSETDRSRISEQFLSSTTQNLSVVALNADMLDSDSNHVKVELFGAQFKNLANEQCFLVAVREMQDVEPVGRPPSVYPTDALSLEGSAQLVVMYDVCTFDIYLMSRKMEQFCEASLGDTHADNILDLASPNSRLSFAQQLQQLGNQIFALQDRPTEKFRVNFNLLGLGEATASVSVEHDHVLDSWTGTMAIRLNAIQSSRGLTASRLQSLPDDGAGHSIGWPTRPRSRSSSSGRSRRSQRTSRSSSQRSGAIGELHPGRSIPL